MEDIQTTKLLIQGLLSPDHETQENAAKTLKALADKGLSSESGKLALLSAGMDFPERKYDWEDTAEELIRAAASIPQPEYIPVIKQHFPNYSANSKTAALQLLAKLDSREASTTFTELLCGLPANTDLKRLGMQDLHKKPRDPEIFFPKLLECCTNPALSWDIYLLLLTYLQKDLITTPYSSIYANTVKASYAEAKEVITPAQQTEGLGWIWEDEYLKARDITSLLLDIMGYLSPDAVLDTLNEALSYQDPRLKYFAVQSLLKMGEAVDNDTLFSLAASAEVRSMLFHHLNEIKRLDLYPKEYFSKEAFAEADMVNWLIFPTELGRAPDQIELMKVVEIDTQTEDGIIEFYVFRFRTLPPHWAAKDGWMAGISGPYLQTDPPGELSPSETFSSFEPWESKTPEEHVGDIQEILADWARHHNRG